MNLGDQVNIDWCTPKMNSNSSRDGFHGIILSNYVQNDKRRSSRVGVSFCVKTMRHFRWAIGDKIILGDCTFAGEYCIAIRRNPSLGFSLSPASTKKGENSKTLAGKVVRSKCQASGTSRMAETLPRQSRIALREIIECDDFVLIPVAKLEKLS